MSVKNQGGRVPFLQHAMKAKGSLILVVPVPYYHDTTIISILKNRPQMPVPPIIDPLW